MIDLTEHFVVLRLLSWIISVAASCGDLIAVVLTLMPFNTQTVSPLFVRIRAFCVYPLLLVNSPAAKQVLAARVPNVSL